MTAPTSTATIVFTDLVGSTRLRATLGEERADELRRVHDRLLGEQVTAAGGRVVKGGGDGLLAAFESASTALGACVEMQRAVARYNQRPDRLAELSVRIGLSAGDVSWEDGDCFGTPVVEAARLEAVAEGGQIICSEYVRMMARGRGNHELVGLGELELKGLPDPISAYQMVWSLDLASVRPETMPPSLAADLAGPFVGREHEFALVLSELDTSERLGPAVVWLLGEPGIGKTSLAARIAAERHQAGWTVLFGRCTEALQAPYQPVAQALRDARQRQPQAIVSLPTSVRRGLARLCPDVIDLPPPPDEDGQDQLFEAVRGWLSHTAANTPTVLVIDDVHWATDTTLLLVDYLLRTVDTRQLVLLATLRDTECPPLLRAIIDETIARPGAMSLHVTGLSPEAVAALAGGDDGARLHSQTAGNPFFVRALVAGGGVHSESVDAAVRRRVARLAQPTQDLLRVAALAGLEFDLPVLAVASADGVNPAGAEATLHAVLAAVEEAAGAALVQEVAANRYRFAHALVRDNLGAQLSATRRARAHRRLAQAYQTVSPAELNSIAHHWSEAALDAETRQLAVTHLLAAGDAAAAAFDHDAAVRVLRRAWELTEDADVAVLAQVLAALGRCLLTSGSRSDETAAVLTQAIATAGRAGLAELQIWSQFRLYLLHATRGTAPPSIVVPNIAADAVKDPVMVARAEAADASWRYWAGGAHQVDLNELERILHDARRSADPLAVAWIANMVSAALPPERAQERIAANREAIAALDAVNESTFVSLAHGRVLGDLVAVSALADAEAELALIQEASLRRRDPFLAQYYEVAASTVHLLRGDLAGAERAAGRAAAIAEGIEGLDVAGLHGLQMFSIRREQGRLGEIAGPLRMWSRINPSMAGTWRPGLIAACAELGLHEQAREELDRVVVGTHIDLPEDERLLVSASYLVDAAAAINHLPAAAVLYELFTRWQHINIQVMAITCYGPAQRYLGMLALTLGELEPAARHLHAALAQCQAMGTPTFEVHARYWLARVAQARGDDGTAALHARAGLALAQQVGMVGLVDRFRRLTAGGPSERSSSLGA